MASWRSIIGPLITLAVVSFIQLGEHYLYRVPNPGAITFIAVAFSAYFGGIVSGLISAAISFGFAAIHFSMPGALFHYNPANFERMLVLTICTPAVVAMIGVLQARAQKARAIERDSSQELQSLRAALDQSEVGVLVLDSGLRMQFANRAFRRLWRLSDELASAKPGFAELVERGRDSKTYDVPADKIDSYLEERTAHVRAGNERPVDIRLADGDVIRCRCKVLADGGRMLTYGNVSDLVRSANEMAELANKDALTGIFNRRHFMNRLDGEWKRYMRYARPLSLLMLDIDHFKSINDRFGHDVGDQVIIAAGGLCRSQTRDSDVAARIGGEEFAILLTETEGDVACGVAERLRTAMSENGVGIRGETVTFTVSIGVASADAAFTSPAELMQRADQALYAAKRGGRNRVAAAESTCAAA